MTGGPIRRRARGLLRRLLTKAVRLGAPPAWFGYRVVISESLAQLAGRHAGQDNRVRIETVHPLAFVENPLPENIADHNRLPADAGWWGYAFRDVPNRRHAETVLATLPNCRVVPYIDARREFWVTVLDQDRRALDLREMQLRPWHRDVLRRAPITHRRQAVWILERVYHNYSHWLTAHLPKLLLLREQGLTGEVLMAPELPSFIEQSLRLFDFEPKDFPIFDPSRLLAVDELTLLSTDRFRPELLEMVRRACPRLTDAAPHRRVFISRQGAERRRLVNEDELWPLLRERGFERVQMEALTVAEQVRLMQETEVLCAPHGAGLTNMLFCAPGTHIIELADLDFPNPNFYAMASALALRYWIVEAQGLGDVHPLEKDLRVEPEQLAQVLTRLFEAAPAETRETVAGQDEAPPYDKVRRP